MKVETDKLVKMDVVMGESEYGNPQPRVTVSFPGSMHHRECRVALLHLAAAVEARSMGEEWIVNIGPVCWASGKRQVARLHLELATDSVFEAKRGLAVLQQAAR